MDSGYTLHVGDDKTYVAIYATGRSAPRDSTNQHLRTGLNHVGITVSDIRECEARVAKAGYTPFNYASYEPGERFYFLDRDNIEFEVISYA